MNELSDSEIGAPVAPQLLLNTWFFLYLHSDRSTGGLPSDFLTNGAASLLLFDSVACDTHALEWELPYAKRWVSGKLWRDLKDARLIRTIDMQRIAAKTVVPHLRQSGVADRFLELMHGELDRIRSKRVSPDTLEIPSAVKELNKFMFEALHVEIPGAMVYPGQENYFKPEYRRACRRLPVEVPASEGTPGTRQRSFFDALKTFAPGFELLPRVPRKALPALRRGIRREKEFVLRYAFGDPDVTPEDILEYRLGESFEEDDAKVDSMRENPARKNFQKLLDIREKTTDVRGAVRETFAEIMGGRKTLSSVGKDLAEARRALMAYLPKTPEVKFKVRFTTAAMAAGILELAFSLAEATTPLWGSHISSLALAERVRDAAPFVHQLARKVEVGGPALDVALAAYEYMRGRSEFQRNAEMRRQYPVAIFVRDVEEAFRQKP